MCPVPEVVLDLPQRGVHEKRLAGTGGHEVRHAPQVGGLDVGEIGECGIIGPEGVERGGQRLWIGGERIQVELGVEQCQVLKVLEAEPPRA